MSCDVEINGSLPPTLSRLTSGLRINTITPGVLPREMSSRRRGRFMRHVMDELEGPVKVGENTKPITGGYI